MERPTLGHDDASPGSPPPDEPARPSVGVMAARLARLALGLVVILLALIGVLSLTRGTPVERVRVAGKRNAFPAVTSPAFERTMALHTGAPISGGHDVELLTNGNGTYPRLWADLRAARRSITVQMYFSQPGAVADTMAAVLAERARAGVRVLLVLDAFGSQNLSQGWEDSLASSGVSVARLRTMRWYRADRVGRRSHVRVVVVDGLVGYTGGFGLADYWLGDGHRDGQWRETNVRFRGPAVAQLQAAFTTAWAEAKGELLTGDLFFPLSTAESSAPPTAPLAVSGVRAALLFTAPPDGSTPAERFLALSIASARRTLYISNSYFLPDDDFRGFLCDAAGERVDVRVLTAGTKTDIKSVYYASRARYAALLACGVRIFEYQPTMMHAKTIVVDGSWSAIGSMNFDNRSLALNNEANLVTLDIRLGASMDSLFLDDLRYAREIVTDQFDRRPAWQRVFEFGANLLSPVL